MSSVVFNANTTQQQQSQNSIEQLFPTTIGGATKMYQRYQHIMPAPEQHQQQQSNLKSSNGLTIKTRKYTPRGMALATSTAATTATATAATTMPYNVDQSQSVQRRNARERNRVKQVNNSFARLRQHIPQSIIADLTKGGGRGPHKKISKVDTLRIAVEYIRRLQDLVDDLNGGATTAATATTAGNHLNLCLDETSCNSSSSSSSSSTHSSSNSSHHIYSYNNHSNHSSSHSSSNHSNNLLQQQQQLQRQQFPNNPLTPITLNGNHLLQPFAATQQLQQQLLQQHQQQQQQHQLQQLQQQQQQQPQLATTTTGACHSPTSSFNSSMSFDSGTYEAAPQQLSPPAPASSSSSSSSNSSSSAALDAQLQLKFEPYEHFQLDEEDCTPDDEEILDYISLWQEQ
ncbi:hypothetical protein KR215_004842 [Drosophila sulfurigaster]|nr:hypothetical protein KR215_004842 [Drosophila sulfurigaster]